jgi:hypothetical protein
MTVDSFAHLVGVNTRTVQRWEREPSLRVYPLPKRIVDLLYAWTPEKLERFGPILEKAIADQGSLAALYIVLRETFADRLAPR